MPRLLFGPVDRAFADRCLDEWRAAGDCRTFGPDGDLTVPPAAAWAEVAAALPPGWAPDLVALWLPYQSVPAWAWGAPVPVVGLAGDWNLLWHTYRHVLPLCDAVLTDAPGVEVMARAGLGHARPANLFGLGRDFLDHPFPPPDARRDIDVLFVGNLHPAVQAERLPWLGRLAALADRHRVAVLSGAHGADYRALLARAKVVFNRSIRGECNQRAFEAAVAGAVLLQEAGNAEVSGFFSPGAEFREYTSGDLETVIDGVLADDAGRVAVAAAAQRRARGYGFAELVGRGLRAVLSDRPTLDRRARDRLAGGAGLSLAGRVWQEAGRAGADHDPGLAADLESAGLQYELGLLAPGPEEAGGRFRRAGPHRLARLALADVLAAEGRSEEAADAVRDVVSDLDRAPALSPAEADVVPPPLKFDWPRVGWERAAWAHAGDPGGEAAAKGRLVRWAAHARLADLTGDLAHYYEAAVLAPDVPATRAALGCALARAGRPREALSHLRAATDGNPFDPAAARSYYQALRDAGEAATARAFAAARVRLGRVAPAACPAEPWMADAAPALEPFRVVRLSAADFAARFGSPDTRRALSAFTPPADTHAVLALLAWAGGRRVLEIGTAAGHMTANLTEWSPADATVFSVGATEGLAPAGGAAGQAPELPPPGAFGRHADHFGKAGKVRLFAADSRAFDFPALAPLDFAFLDGGHDFGTALSDTRAAYAALRPGGVLAWHDFESVTPWVKVRDAVEAFRPAEPVYHVAGTEVAFLVKGETPPAPAAPAGPAVHWEGEFEVLASLALVNRQFADALVRAGVDLTLGPTPNRGAADPLPWGSAARALLGRRRPDPPAVWVRHAWPPDFAPPPAGAFVLIQPWEFGSLPADWVGPIRERVDEVWCYTRAVADCYLGAGLPPDRVRVVPLGVDVDRFRPGLDPLPLNTRKRFRFLFVGGTIPRKGFDVLLRAYGRAFTRADDVCLVVQDMGSATFYYGQTMAEAVRRFAADPAAPEVEYRADPTPEADLPRLYAACHVLAHPYRAEGFGLPVLEAMACGLPAVVTAGGAADDFCPPDAGFRVPARRAALPENGTGYRTVGTPWWLEPDEAGLIDALRAAARSPARARQKAAAAARRASLGWTWYRAAAVAVAACRDLAARRPVRLPRPAADPGPPPNGGELASVIIPCFNRADLTRRCLDSVLAHTRPPFELVLVDDGSADGTPDVFAAAARDGRAARVTVVRHNHNRGYVAAANAGLEAATGTYLVLLNNDTVVTPGWLDGLVRWSLDRYPRVGLVGPVTNGTRPPQRVDPEYGDLAGLAAFAARRAGDHAGRALETDWLTGFCLLLRRDVYERLGGLDGRYGRGFFDDDDYCVRARRAGYTLLIAPGVYVHHDIGGTFGPVPPTSDAFQENFRRFREKWGDAETASYLNPRAPVPRAGPPRVSLTMIVRNEEANLPDCLDGLRGLFHEIVVVDTGSADRTREVAREAGARVFDVPWADSFAAARNAALDRATGDYAFWLDADDRLDPDNRGRLTDLLRALNGAPRAYVMKCRCLSDRPGGPATVVDHVRLFPLRPDVRWDHRVHEQILPALRRAGTEVRWADVTVTHVGYADPAVRRRKLDRDLRLLRLDLEEKPGHPFTLFNLGSVYAEAGDQARALECLTASLRASDPRDSIVRKLYSLIAQAHRQLGRPGEAAACVREGLGHYPEDAELGFLDGLLRREARDLVGAEAAFRALLAGREGEHFASVDDALRGVKARHNLAVVYAESGRPERAAEEWRAVVGADPGFGPAWAGLADLALRSRDAAAFDEAMAALDALSPADAAHFRGRWSAYGTAGG
jgi:GT2 family glycosyltransferase/glycosyltransferase involved in cell wall biosynthesis/tetratricopeptide (TPR) repeat protein